jgi:putative ABC transport system permease protein
LVLFVWTELRRSVRSLSKSPALAAVAITSLALGIGANVTTYSVVREMILDDVSAWRADRLAFVSGTNASYSLYRDLRSAGAFQDLAFHRGIHERISRAETNDIVWTLTTSSNFFDVLDIRASKGRLYSQRNQVNEIAGNEIAVVSHGFWRKRLHSDPHVIGQPIELNGKLYTVTGVLPADYRSVYGHGVSPEIYLSDPGNANSADHLYQLFGRMRDGFSREQTRQAFEAVLARLGSTDAEQRNLQLRPMSGWRAHAAGAADERRFFLFFAMLFVVAGTLALIACSNVAGLLLVRALNRRRDQAIRKAIGANRFQIALPLFLDGLVLVICGATLGLLLDAFLRDRLSEVRWPTAYGLSFEFHFHNDKGLFLYASLATFAVILFSCLLPVLRGSHADLSFALKQAEPSLSIRRWNLRSGFVILQVTLSMALLTLGAIFTRSLVHIARNGPGFDVTHTLIATLHALPGSPDLRPQLVRRVELVPGVVGVTSAGILPLMGEIPDATLRQLGAPLSTARHVYVLGAGEGYFTTLGIPILRGRDFEIQDRDRKPAPVFVNQTLAREFFGAAEPIGRVLLAGLENEEHLEIVGVAADSKMRTLGEGNKPAFFRPDFNTQLLVRVAGNSAQWIEPLRNALRQVDPTAALQIRPMQDAASGAMFPLRVASGFVGSMSSLALILALVGLYASVSDAVSRRTREMGIRSALGASQPRIVWVAIKDGLAVLGCGAVLGLSLALAAIAPLTDLLPNGVNPWDSTLFSAIAFLLISTGAAAAWIPARRAAQMDPTAALRQE